MNNFSIELLFWMSLQAPGEFGFIEVVDLFFKVHFVLGQKFHEKTKRLFDFIAVYIYGMRIPKASLNVTTRKIAVALGLVSHDNNWNLKYV